MKFLFGIFAVMLLIPVYANSDANKRLVNSRGRALAISEIANLARALAVAMGS